MVLLLKQLATRGNTVIISIHQPRASVYALFDEVTLLSEGSVIFSGPVGGLAKHFNALGFQAPANTNPIEYYVDLISIDYSSPEHEKLSRSRVEELARAFRQKNPIEEEFQVNLPVTNPVSRELKRAKGPLAAVAKGMRVFGTLFRRAWRQVTQPGTTENLTLTPFANFARQVTRDFPLNFARLMSSLFVSLLYGAIYNNLGLGAGSIPDRLGLLQIAAVSTAMTTVVKATTSFVTERQIVNRERRSGSYSTLPYLLSKLAAEAPLAMYEYPHSNNENDPVN